MDETLNVASAKYQQIAADIATKIVEHQYEIGEKIYARSLIASQYSVSSETARKAIAILADLGIVETIKGSGVIIKSYENAIVFLRRFRDAQTLTDFKKKTLDSISKLNKDSLELRENITKLIDHIDNFRSLNPLVPFSIFIEEGMSCVGKSIGSLNFWHNTAATIVAIRRDDVLICSPGPYAELLVDDTVYFVGENDCPARVEMFFKEIAY